MISSELRRPCTRLSCKHAPNGNNSQRRTREMRDRSKKKSDGQNARHNIRQCQFVTISDCPSVSLSLCQLVILSACHSVSSSICQFVTLLVRHSVSYSLVQSLILSVCHCQLVTHSMHSNNARDIWRSHIAKFLWLDWHSKTKCGSQFQDIPYFYVFKIYIRRVLFLNIYSGC